MLPTALLPPSAVVPRVAVPPAVVMSRWRSRTPRRSWRTARRQAQPRRGCIAAVGIAQEVSKWIVVGSTRAAQVAGRGRDRRTGSQNAAPISSQYGAAHQTGASPQGSTGANQLLLASDDQTGGHLSDPAAAGSLGPSVCFRSIWRVSTQRAVTPSGRPAWRRRIDEHSSPGTLARRTTGLVCGTVSLSGGATTRKTRCPPKVSIPRARPSPPRARRG